MERVKDTPVYRFAARRSKAIHPCRLHDVCYCSDCMASLSLPIHGRAIVDDEPALTTQYFKDWTRSIIAHNDSPHVGFAYSINPCRGCEHGWPSCQFHLDDSLGC
jgi:hypothetical protein